jgi:citrate lyase subunit beta/citryl-CoA lyase
MSAISIMRSWLFVPAHQRRMVNKALALGADVVVLDLEDAVPAREKGAAREVAREALARRREGLFCFVRVNSLSSGRLEDDLQAVVAAGLDGLALPKAEEPEDVLRLDGRLRARESEAGLPDGSVDLLAIIESPRGVIHAPAIAASSPRLAALMFGAEDFALDMRLPLTGEREDDGMVYARSAVAIAAASERLQAVDRVYPHVTRSDALRRDARQGRRLGFTGKGVIHPNQIPIVNQAFRPTADEVAYAQQVVELFQRSEAEGRGAVALEGRLVDLPVVERAREVLQMHRALKLRERTDRTDDDGHPSAEEGRDDVAS